MQIQIMNIFLVYHLEYREIINPEKLEVKSNFRDPKKRKKKGLNESNCELRSRITFSSKISRWIHVQIFNTLGRVLNTEQELNERVRWKTIKLTRGMEIKV